jgi:hypothetical protein
VHTLRDAHQNIGAHFAAYEVLQRLGFGFLHPLQPLVPDQLDLSFAAGSAGFDLATSPHFAFRGVHYHTEHPLELMEFLNGFDVAPANASAGKGEPWESMMSEWERALEWTVANRQNRWEWILLWAQEWDAFAWSELRRSRLTRIVDTAHAWAVVAGAGTHTTHTRHARRRSAHRTYGTRRVCRLRHSDHATARMAADPERDERSGRAATDRAAPRLAAPAVGQRRLRL